MEVAGLVVAFILVAAGILILARRLFGSVLKNLLHELLILDRIDRIPRIFYLLLSNSTCKSCPFISVCLKN